MQDSFSAEAVRSIGDCPGFGSGLADLFRVSDFA